MEKKENFGIRVTRMVYILVFFIYLCSTYWYIYTNTSLFYYVVERSDGPSDFGLNNKTPEVVCDLSYQPEGSISLFYLNKKDCYYLNPPNEPLIYNETGFMPSVIKNNTSIIMGFIVLFFILFGNKIWRKLQNVRTTD